MALDALESKVAATWMADGNDEHQRAFENTVLWQREALVLGEVEEANQLQVLVAATTIEGEKKFNDRTDEKLQIVPEDDDDIEMVTTIFV
jgi:hypothetical protein